MLYFFLYLINIHKLYYKSHLSRAYHLQGNILSCYPVILPWQVIFPSEVSLISAFHEQQYSISFFLQYYTCRYYYTLVALLLSVQL